MMDSIFRKLSFFAVFILSITIKVFGQAADGWAKADTLVLSDGTVLAGSVYLLDVEEPFVLCIDSSQYSLAAVNKFKWSGNWFYVKHGFRMINEQSYDNSIATKRLYKGKISLFTKYATDNTDSEKRDYFTVDDYLREYNYDNLSYFLTQEERCSKVLGEYKKLSFVRNFFLVTGAIITTYSLIDTARRGFANDGFNIPPVFFVGIGSVGISFIPKIFAKRKLNKAVDIYNGLD